jgi:hypothetical protein
VKASTGASTSEAISHLFKFFISVYYVDLVLSIEPGNNKSIAIPALSKFVIGKSHSGLEIYRLPAANPAPEQESIHNLLMFHSSPWCQSGLRGLEARFHKYRSSHNGSCCNLISFPEDNP